MEEAREESPPFNAAQCIAALEELLDKCDAAQRTRAALHIHQAIEALKADRK